MTETKLTVLDFPIDRTRTDRPVSRVLESVIDNMEDIKEITFFGRNKEGSRIFYSTLPMHKDVLWELEQLKHFLLFE